jgi:methionyl-tRNA formyltransferase
MSIALIIELNFRHPKTDTVSHLRRYFALMGVKGSLYVMMLLLKSKFKWFMAHFIGRDGYTIKQIAGKNNIPYFKVRDINSKDSIQLLVAHNIDYIINSGNQIYRGGILTAFKGRILNRHTSLLPAYAGIYPIFWQMLHGKEKGGVTLHWINNKIDDGEIAYQKAMNISRNNSLFDHYRVGFQISLELCNRAIHDLEVGVIHRNPMIGERNYCSWPTPEDVQAFHRKGLRIC